MTPEARIAVNAMYAMIESNGGGQPGQTYNVEPRVAQAIEDKVVQENAFLQLINNHGVNEIKGDVLAFGIPSTITRRTRVADPSRNNSLRRPTDPTGLEQREYECFEVEQDTVISWSKIDNWAHLPNFYERYRQQVMFAQARDRLLVMWHGQDNVTATNTDPVEYPLLQDVNKGFIQYMIDTAPENVYGLKPDGSVDTIKIDASDPAADFKSLDQLVYHLRHEMLHKLFRNRTGLRCLIGDELVVAENSTLLGSEHQQKPSERTAANLYLSTQEFGQIQRVKSDEFPERAIVLTELSNLSRYWQTTSLRRKIKEDDHEHKGIVDYNFVREDYVVEAAEGCVMVHPDAIQLKDKTGAYKPAKDVWKMAAATDTASE